MSVSILAAYRTKQGGDTHRRREQAAINAYCDALTPITAELDPVCAANYRDIHDQDGRAAAVASVRRHLDLLTAWGAHLDRLTDQLASPAARSFVRGEQNRRAYLADVVHRAALLHMLNVEESTR